jgi:2-octaprenyl-6-methoxyphenol hydroxylase
VALTAVSVAVVGAGPVGLALALHAATLLPHASITLFDARALDHDIARDPRTLALALGSVQLLQRLHAWPEDAAQAITEVHVSQTSPSWRGGEVTLRAAELGVLRLGAVLSYGALVHSLQQRWLALAQADPARLRTSFGTAVQGLRDDTGGVLVDAGIAERFDLAVIAEGGVFAEQSRKSLTHDYAQTAWVGSCTREGAGEGVAIERFTRAGPLALLPLQTNDDGTQRAALVWCVARDDDPLRELDDARRLVLLNSLLPAAAGKLLSLSPLKAFALGLNAERSLVRGRTVRIGNAAQTLHPVAGQGLNLGLRDASCRACVSRATSTKP